MNNFNLDDLVSAVKPKIKKKDDIKYNCYSCNLEKKKGNFRTINNLICIDCERKKYGYKNKLPKLPKNTHNKTKVTRQNILNTKVTGYGGVYLITCLTNKKKYIGESSNLRRRKDNYTKKDGYINPQLLKDIEKYGLTKFTFDVLAVMEKSTKDERLEIEAFYKAKYPSEELYNILPGIESKEAYQQWKEQQSVDN